MTPLACVSRSSVYVALLALLMLVSLSAGCASPSEAPSAPADAAAEAAPEPTRYEELTAPDTASCAPRPAVGFVYPVLPTGAVPAASRGTVDPRESGWYVWNCFGNRCGSTCSGNSTDLYHPGEDFNLIWSRAVVDRARAEHTALPRRDCAFDADLGEAVYAVANGVVVDVRFVSDALQNAVVVRHDLPEREDVRSWIPPGTTIPEGEARVDHVYSVYLHVSSIGVRRGECVTMGQQLARIANVSNGPHLHFEIVRPTPAYDANAAAGHVILAGRRSGYYPTLQSLADFGHLQPSRFVREHRITWHPVGTLVQARRGLHLIDRVAGRAVVRPVSPDRAAAWRFDLSRAVTISEGEFDCYDPGDALDAPPRQEIYRIVTSPTVWRVDLDGRFRQPFVSGEAFISWGYSFPVMNSYSLDAFRYATWPARDPVRLRDGSLFRTLSDPRVYVVTEGRRRHVADPDVFAALGYQEPWIYRVGDGTETELGGAEGERITASTLHVCENGHRERLAEDCVTCSSSTTTVDVGGACEPRVERCNGVDDDCDHLVDEGFDLARDPLNCGACGRACTESERCESARCVALAPPMSATDAALDASPDAAVDVASEAAADRSGDVAAPVDVRVAMDVGPDAPAPDASAPVDAPLDSGCVPACTPGAMRCQSATQQLRCLAPFGRVIPCATWSMPETCSPDAECVDGVGCRSCGTVNQPCCGGTRCQSWLYCVSGRCSSTPAPTGPREVCDGADNDGDSLVDEDFICRLGARGDWCRTSCGSVGYLACERSGDVCTWGSICHPLPESDGSGCSDSVDNDCNGLVDCADPACATASACAHRCGDRRCDAGETCSTCADCACATGTVCASGACVACGRRDGPCCDGSVCDGGLRCSVDRCSCPDADGDGATDARCGGSDCNDGDPRVNAAQAERCNGADDNCNGAVDESVAPSGACTSTGVGACARAGQLVCVAGAFRCDATEGRPSTEVCNGVDDDCDGEVDEGCRLLRVELSAAAQRECAAGGWQLVTWDPTGREYAPLAAAGQPLEFTVPAGWRGMLGVGARCLERTTRWRDWSPFLDRMAPAAGVARVGFDGRDITARTPVCFPYWVQDAHPDWLPAWGSVLLVPLEPSLEGTCPRRP